MAGQQSTPARARAARRRAAHLATQFDKAVLRCRNDWDRHLSPSLERMGRSMGRMWEAHADMVEHRRGMEEARQGVGPVLPPRLRRTLDCLLEQTNSTRSAPAG